MPDDLLPPAGASPDDSVDPGGDDKSGSVKLETHRRLLDEKKKIQKERDDLLSEKKRLEDAEALKQGNFEKLLNESKAKIQTLEQQIKANNDLENDRKRFAAVLKGLGGAVEERWNTIIANHLDEVKFGDDGALDQASVNTVTDALKKTFPEIVKKDAPGMPNGKPAGGAAQTINRSDWEKLPYAEMRKWRLDQIVG